MPSFKIIELSVLEEKIFKEFYHIWAWRPSWSCDLDHEYKLLFFLSQGGSAENLFLIDRAVLAEKLFENDGHIHVYSPGAGADNPHGSIFSLTVLFSQ